MNFLDHISHILFLLLLFSNIYFWSPSHVYASSYFIIVYFTSTWHLYMHSDYPHRYLYPSGKTNRGAYSAWQPCSVYCKGIRYLRMSANSEEQRTFTGWRARERIACSCGPHDFNSLKNVITHKPKNQIKFRLHH
jgi:hypothetical protein